MRWLVLLLSCLFINCGSADTGSIAGTGTGTDAGDSAGDGDGTVTSETSGGSGASSGTGDSGEADTSDGSGDSGETGDDPPGPFTILNAFDGDFATGPTGRGKPEMNVAANGSQVAQVTWQHLNVYDYTGTLLQSTALPTVITNAGLGPSESGLTIEPHIVFDEFIQRWIIVVSCAQDCVLVSDGTDATTTNWQGFYLDGNGNDPSMHLAYDKNGVYFSEVVVANFNPDTPCCSSNVFAIPNSELEWTTTLAPTHKNKHIGKPHELMPVNDHDPDKDPGAATFFVARTCPAGNSCQGNAANPITNDPFRWIVSYGTWSGTTFTMTSNHTSLCAGGTAPSDQCIRTDPDGASDRWLYNTPIDPNQPDTPVQLRAAESHRINDAMQHAGHIYLVTGSGPCVSACGTHGDDAGNDIFIFADLDCSTPDACTVSQTQKVSGPDHLFWPTIGVNSNGDVGILANYVNAAESYMGIAAWTHLTTDAPGVLDGPTIVSAGTTPYVCSLGANNIAQTGNPVGIATLRDPVDPTALWTTEQYAADGGDCHWKTRIVEYRP